ncbi:MAG: UvrD-helicase domain-containing protein [Bacteroidales bacterium]
MLKIYKASAGSGKTYNLTLEYLRLLFNSKDSYRHILAVTFTNKATEEMKSRIVSDLHKIASGAKSGYIEILCQEFKLEECELRERARVTLTQLLHDYSSFNISTIDKFFQQTMRAFTREIGLQGGYNVELDSDRVLSEAVDSMLLSLSQNENNELLSWLLEYSESLVEDGGNWNFTNQIKSLGAEILKEEYRLKSSQIDETHLTKQQMREYIKKMFSIKRGFEARVKENGAKAMSILDSAGVESSDMPKYGVRDQFEKWRLGDLKEYKKAFEAVDEPDKWTKAKPKADVKNRVNEAYYSGAGDILRETVQLYINEMWRYKTSVAILQNIFTLGIINDINRQIQEYKRENNIMLLADTTQLLNKIIDGSDTPFIYEKIGTQINHYMIDEFQDTSGMQWSNFSPLLHESQSSEYFNMIVGDVKQSIYRWRSSDWTLLDSKLYEEFDESERIDQVLKVNYRSRPEIINFNNAFFRIAAATLQRIFNEELENSAISGDKSALNDRIISAYQDIYQEISAQKIETKGRVSVEFIEQNGRNKEEWKSEALERMTQEVMKLQDRGYRLKDIAILVRTNGEAVEIASHLLQYKMSNLNSKYRFDIISNQALLLNNAPSVRLILSILKYFRDPSEEVNRTIVATEYAVQHKGRAQSEAISEYFDSKVNENETTSIFSLELESELRKIGRKPLYEMCEQIVANFLPKENSNDKIFIQALLDTVLDFTHNHTSDLAAFLDWWEEFGIRKTVTTPDSQDAIQIITVHKSKGLSFPVMIIPFCDWSLSPKNSMLWCTPQVEPFNEIPLLPIKYRKDLLETIFAEPYLIERLQTLIDNLNVAYVAFTRPEEEMILIGPKGKEGDYSSFSKLMYNIINDASQVEDEQGNNYIDLSDYWSQEESTFSLGEEFKVQKEVSKLENQLSSSNFISFDPYHNKRIELRFYADEYFTDGNERRSGKIRHEILSRVNTPDDLPRSVQQAIIDGLATTQECQGYERELAEKLQRPEVAAWFSADQEVLNEISLLHPTGIMLRPDRILRSGDGITVIDYKFGKENKSNIKQVEDYIIMIKEMGYSDVVGYLWYVMSDKIEEIRVNLAF